LVSAGKLQSDFGEDRNGLGLLSWLRTIRLRLFLAFGFAAGMTVVGSLFALYASANISATMTQIVARSMPATVESLRLSEEASALVASAPRLMAVEDEDHRKEIAHDITAQSRMLSERIERLQSLDASESDEIEVARAALDKQLDALNQVVTGRIKISTERRALALSVRKFHESLLEGITPAIDDANFDLMTRKPAAQDEAALNQSIDSLRRLLEIEAGTNLLAGLLIESSMVGDSADLPPLRDLIAAAKRNIEANLKALSDSIQRDKIGALYRRLASIAGDDGMVAVRNNELDRERDTQLALAAALSDAARLKKSVESLIARQGEFAQALSTRAITQIQVGRVLLIVLSVAALAVAGLIAWLYVGRSIVGRLTLLSGAMRRIADGELDVPVPVGGQDEIAGMAQALVIFRQAIVDVTAAQQREGQRAQESELHSEQLETATQKFELAVNDIIQALDSASKSMDGCAHVMARTADHNQTQAVAAASASADAMANAGNVAMAAEEIALSVGQISDQARASAEIARRATSEATAIIGAVEQLATSVDHINSVSSLIRDVAAQTNLLALNATIEAARAGDAGRGFAVVAQEVKGLAAQTEKATGEITQQIFAIEQTTSRVVEAMKAIAGTIAQLDRNAVDISAAVEQQDGVSKGIARSASAAANHTREVSASVAQVSDAAIKTGEVANAVLSAGNELAARSQRLKAEVERFLAQVRVA
jgi:methyl-accepting chemotaxis protein